MLALALLLLVPTVTLAWWSRVVARHARAVTWVMPVVLGAWLATTVLAVVSLVSAFRASHEVDAAERSVLLNAGVVDAFDLVSTMLAVLVVCAVFTAIAARRSRVAPR